MMMPFLMWLAVVSIVSLLVLILVETKDAFTMGLAGVNAAVLLLITVIFFTGFNVYLEKYVVLADKHGVELHTDAEKKMLKKAKVREFEESLND